MILPRSSSTDSWKGWPAHFPDLLHFAGTSWSLANSLPRRSNKTGYKWQKHVSEGLPRTHSGCTAASKTNKQKKSKRTAWLRSPQRDGHEVWAMKHSLTLIGRSTTVTVSHSWPNAGVECLRKKITFFSPCRGPEMQILMFKALLCWDVLYLKVIHLNLMHLSQT